MIRYYCSTVFRVDVCSERFYQEDTGESCAVGVAFGLTTCLLPLATVVMAPPEEAVAAENVSFSLQYLVQFVSWSKISLTITHTHVCPLYMPVSF